MCIRDSLDVVLAHVRGIAVGEALGAQVLERLERDIGVDPLGAIACQRAEMMHFARFAGFDDEAGLHPQALADQLVMHGGGNTSVKTSMADLLGEHVQVLCVKGSGWDMADIEPPGLPAVRMEPLLKLRSLQVLSDEDMVRFQRGALVDPSSPNPSVETLLHAFLPHKFVDHTHSAAVLALTDQATDEALLREVYGDRVALVDYVKPGVDLSLIHI